MWKYNYTDGDYLEHRLVDGRRVKYVAKVSTGNGKYRYFYTNAEYQAYLNQNKSTQRTLKDGTVKTPSTTKKTATPPSPKTANTLRDGSTKFGTKSSNTTSKKTTTTKAEEPKVSKEYKEELAYNSKKNVYFDGSKTSSSSKKSSSNEPFVPKSASKEYWEAMGYDIDTLKYNSKTGQYELTEDSKKGSSKKSSSTKSNKTASTESASDEPVIFTLNKDTGETELISGVAEAVQKGKNWFKEFLKKIDGR